MGKLLTSILAGVMAFGIGGCVKEKKEAYSLEMKNGYVCQASFGESQDHVWIGKGKQLIGTKTICRCTGDNCMPAVSYAVDPSGTSRRDNFVLSLVNENGEFTTDLSWYDDPKVRKEYKQLYSLIKECESLLEQKYKRGF
jgi:hypothetical protein